MALRSLSLLATSLVVAAGLGGSPARAADWTLQPAANAFGADRQELAYTVNPGGAVEDGVVVGNPGPAPLRLSVVAADARTVATGELGVAGSRRGVGAWTVFARRDVTVAPGRSVAVAFTLTVPRAARPGDHAGFVVVAAGGGARVALPLRLRVGGALRPALAVQNLRVHRSTVSYVVRNTGNATLAARSSVKVSGPFGTAASRADGIADTPSLLPGEAWKVSTTAHEPAAAIRTTATVSVTPLLTDAAGSTAPLPAVEATAHAWAIPWLVLVPLLALAVLGLRVRRRSGGSAPCPPRTR
jgi:hypothetical protein